MQTQTVNVREDQTVLIACPYCGHSRVVSAVPYKNRRAPLKVICTCRQAFSVALEWRRAYRKRTYLEGYYCKLPESKDWKRMVVRDISETGIGFDTSGAEDIKIGEELMVKLLLELKRSPIIERCVVVKAAGDKYLGCQFTRKFPMSTLYLT